MADQLLEQVRDAVEGQIVGFKSPIAAMSTF